MDDIQAIQSDQYQFPYHYLPSLTPDGSSFAASRSWGFSLSYVTALHHVSQAIAKLGGNSHIDVGCGDGALVHLLRKRHPDIRLAGVDYDRKAIEWAKMFSPGATFHSGDLHDLDPEHGWDSASLVEVVEHIPPESLPHFAAGVRRLLHPGSRLIVTVPHRNKPVSDKHYQHFSFDSIAAVFGDGFIVEDIFGFEVYPIAEILYRRLFDRPKFHLESEAINRVRLRYQIDRKDRDERRCGRIFAVLKAT